MCETTHTKSTGFVLLGLGVTNMDAAVTAVAAREPSDVLMATGPGPRFFVLIFFFVMMFFNF
jgi:uncharacterized protein YraI